MRLLITCSRVFEMVRTVMITLKYQVKFNNIIKFVDWSHATPAFDRVLTGLVLSNDCLHITL